MFSVVTFFMIYSEECEQDRLTLYDGDSMDSNTPSQVYCGSVGPDQFITTSNHATLHLITSRFGAGNNRSKLFFVIRQLTFKF